MDDMLVTCEVCGAWLTVDEAATFDDFHGCWYEASGRSGDTSTCSRQTRSPLALGIETEMRPVNPDHLPPRASVFERAALRSGRSDLLK